MGMQRGRELVVAVAAALAGCGNPGDGSTADAAGIDAHRPDAGPRPSPSDPFYDLGTIIDVELTIAAADLARLDLDPHVAVPGTFSALGVTVPIIARRPTAGQCSAPRPIGARRRSMPR